MRFGRGYYTGHVIHRADREAAWAGDDEGGGVIAPLGSQAFICPVLLVAYCWRSPTCVSSGCRTLAKNNPRLKGWISFVQRLTSMETLTAKQLYEILWDHINGQRTWNANPWVWIVEFKRVSA
jgi:hypothetical protein